MKSLCHLSINPAMGVFVIAVYLCFVVFIAQLCLVDGVSLFLVDESRPEVSHTALGPCHQVVGHGNLQKQDIE